MQRILIPATCLLLAACGGGGSDSPDPVAVSPSPAAPVQTPAAPGPAPTPPAASPAPIAASPTPPSPQPSPASPPASSPPSTSPPAARQAPEPPAEASPQPAPTPYPVPQTVQMMCGYQGAWQPMVFTVERAAEPWSRMIVRPAGSMFLIYGGQQIMTDGTFLPQFVADPEGALASSGQYRASQGFVEIGTPGWSTTYAFSVDGRLIGVSIGNGDPRVGDVRCLLDWEGWPDW